MRDVSTTIKQKGGVSKAAFNLLILFRYLRFRRTYIFYIIMIIYLINIAPCDTHAATPDDLPSLLRVRWTMHSACV